MTSNQTGPKILNDVYLIVTCPSLLELYKSRLLLIPLIKNLRTGGGVKERERWTGSFSFGIKESRDLDE